MANSELPYFDRTDVFSNRSSAMQDACHGDATIRIA
jgi:hypothetical protein